MTYETSKLEGLKEIWNAAKKDSKNAFGAIRLFEVNAYMAGASPTEIRDFLRYRIALKN